MTTPSFWQNTPEELYRQLGVSAKGWSEAEAKRRQRQGAGKKIRWPAWFGAIRLLLIQFKSPLVLLLLFAVGLSAALGETTNALIILAILLLTGFLGFWQEYKADRAVKSLRAMVHTTTRVRRDGVWQKRRLDEVVPGDLVQLSAGDLIPGDCLVLRATDLHMNEAALSGESFPVEKYPGPSPAEAPLSRRSGALFQGSNVVNGTAEALVVKTGADTEFGKIAGHLSAARSETAFEQGIDRFGYLLVRVTFFLAAGILLLNLFSGKPVAASILFALALAVGLAPELLPAIMVTTLAAGAERMARAKVIVKRLAAIQNLGAVDVLCSDKTGTLTTGTVEVQSTTGIDNRPSAKVRLYAWLNARFETGFSNPLDEALRQLPDMSAEGYAKCDEVPYDFIRKRLSVVVENDGRHLMITKGALQNMLDVCDRAEDGQGRLLPLDDVRQTILDTYEAQSAEGFRTIGLAWKDVTGDPVINKDDEQGMIFLGFIFLYDPPKPGIEVTVRQLNALGVQLKIITGDNQLVARHIAGTLGLQNSGVLTGSGLRAISDEALPANVGITHIFAEVEPNQKERLIRALRQGGHIVGYLGDGINDATALRAADVGISVEGAVDVAKEASDMILLEKDLDVLRAGILEGRKTYMNTLKYIFITTSANFGNMFSLAGISLVIPFLPLLPAQILLLNFLSDIPALGIAGDRVDAEQLARPKRWNLPLIRRFMTVFGLQSSLFDYLTFGVLLLLFQVEEARFQTAWFVESVLTELLILLIIRTVRPAFRSRPSRFLLLASVSTAALVLLLPYLPFMHVLGFVPLPLPLLGGMVAIALLYGVMVEVTKSLFFRRFNL